MVCVWFYEMTGGSHFYYLASNFLIVSHYSSSGSSWMTFICLFWRQHVGVHQDCRFLCGDDIQTWVSYVPWSWMDISMIKWIWSILFWKNLDLIRTILTECGSCHNTLLCIRIPRIFSRMKIYTLSIQIDFWLNLTIFLEPNCLVIMLNWPQTFVEKYFLGF